MTWACVCDGDECGATVERPDARAPVGWAISFDRLPDGSLHARHHCPSCLRVRFGVRAAEAAEAFTKTITNPKGATRRKRTR